MRWTVGTENILTLDILGRGATRTASRIRLKNRDDCADMPESLIEIYRCCGELMFFGRKDQGFSAHQLSFFTQLLREISFLSLATHVTDGIPRSRNAQN